MLDYFFIALFYAAIVIFFGGILNKFYNWAKSPVALNITTTSGQEKTLDFLPRKLIDRFDSPFTKWETLVRLLLEVFLFRSLFRNTKYYLNTRRQIATKWLWLFALLFHWGLLIILLRHLRFFTSPVPDVIMLLQGLDGLFEVGRTELHMVTLLMTDILILAGLVGLFGRRLLLRSERTLTLPSDWIALILLLGIAVSGIFMRYFWAIDIEAAKEFALGIITFHPVPPPMDFVFLTHLTLVSIALIYFPFSKMMHAGGVLFSPTRNIPNNPRAKRHVNPMNTPYHGITWDEYYNNFKDQMDQIADEGYNYKPEEW